MTGSYRTYYVNQKTGRDSNDGLTMDSPFAGKQIETVPWR